MLRVAAWAGITLGGIVLAAPAWACAEHTFDPCLGKAPAYNIEVDNKTGRTWIKPAPPPVDESGRLGRLSASAKNVPPGSLAKMESAPEGQWQTRVEAEKRPPPPLK
jgi:hypothetical protein